MTKWISVKDEFPKNNTRVLCWDDKDGMYDCFYIDSDFLLLMYSHPSGKRMINRNLFVSCNYAIKDVTHWMPLPSPPENE